MVIFSHKKVSGINRTIWKKFQPCLKEHIFQPFSLGAHLVLSSYESDLSIQLQTALICSREVAIYFSAVNTFDISDLQLRVMLKLQGRGEAGLFSPS